MPVVVRDHAGSSAVSMIEAALGEAPGGLHEGQYVCVGDVIDTEDQVRSRVLIENAALAWTYATSTRLRGS